MMLSVKDIWVFLEAMPDPMIVIDPRGEIVALNAQAGRLFGYRPEELRGQLVESLIPTRFRPQHVQHRAEYFDQPWVRPMGIKLELCGLRRDGLEIPLEISLGPLETTNGLYVLAAIRDVTERKGIETVLREAKDTLEFHVQERTQALSAAKQALQAEIAERKQLEEQFYQAQKLEAIGRLAGGIAHDFSNILMAINTLSDFLLDAHPEADDPRRRDIQQIKKSSDRASALIKQLLAFSRKQILQPQVLNLNEVITNVDKILRRVIGEDVDLTIRLAAELWPVKVDPSQMDQVIMNLVVNARDAMPHGGRLTIETANIELDEGYAVQHLDVKPGSYVRLTISDTGHGMDATTQAHLFEPFFTTKERGKGTGLGLATVHGIIKQSEGQIWVYSEVDQGTTFKIYLPRVEEGVAVMDKNHPPRSVARGSETILLVEDEQIVRELAQRVLVNQGYTVLTASTGVEALALLKDYLPPIDLLITDMVMPGGLSGRDLADQLIPSRPEMKVLYISGYTDDSMIPHRILEPDLAFLEKPFGKNRLAQKVRQVLDGNETLSNGAGGDL